MSLVTTFGVPRTGGCSSASIPAGRHWTAFRLARWTNNTPPAAHLVRPGRHPGGRRPVGGLSNAELQC